MNRGFSGEFSGSAQIRLAQSFAAGLAVALGTKMGEVVEENRDLTVAEPCPSKSRCSAEQVMIACYTELFGRPAFANDGTAELMRDAWAMCRRHDYCLKADYFHIH